MEYAKWLGMDLEKDVDMFWIAREGLKASAGVRERAHRFIVELGWSRRRCPRIGSRARRRTRTRSITLISRAVNRRGIIRATSTTGTCTRSSGRRRCAPRAFLFGRLAAW